MVSDPEETTTARREERPRTRLPATNDATLEAKQTNPQTGCEQAAAAALRWFPGAEIEERTHSI